MSISSPFNQNLLSKEYARPRGHQKTLTIFRCFLSYIGTYAISPCVIDSIYIGFILEKLIKVLVCSSQALANARAKVMINYTWNYHLDRMIESTWQSRFFVARSFLNDRRTRRARMYARSMSSGY